MDDDLNILESLSAYVDGELSEPQRRQVERRLERDPALAAELEKLRAVRRLVSRLPAVHARPGMLQAVLARAERERLLDNSAALAPRRSPWAWVRLAAAAAIIVLVLSGSVLLWKMTTTSYVDNHPIAMAPATPSPSGAAREEKKVRDALPGSPELARLKDQPVFFINTDNLAKAQEEVAKVLESNKVGATSEAVRQQQYKAYQRQVSKTDDQVVVEVNMPVTITDAQLRKIVSGLNNVRSQQNVAQVPQMPADPNYQLPPLAGADDSLALEYRKDLMVLQALQPGSYAGSFWPIDRDPEPTAIAAGGSASGTQPSVAMARPTPRPMAARGIRPPTTMADGPYRQLIVVLNRSLGK